MTASTTINRGENEKVLKQTVLGSRRFSNYLWATIVTVGATGFLLAGISSYLQVNLLLISDPTQLIFVPQGLVMGLYGTAGLLLSLYLWLAILWDLGGGYNEFDKSKNKIKIFRWGFPGKNRRIEIESPIEDAQSVIVEIKEGLNPRRALYLRVKGRRDIPLTRVGQPLSLKELEIQGAELAKFLGVSLEGL
ncbi:MULTISPECIES: photosystem I assembly protein Ycf4 [Mastigocoleus]|uniref:Photosystem I assembly protein Ycf4 n=1 Tax=Mastigocoleus testarum BC008 TaxID=371196 RepID=A0A0V7ZJW4_9CYAN|nr:MULTISPECIES: photosystem I assembly protein Ycf4 [Mastigocoleus]KST64851.1 photosystem I assembly protein [Mastigocoleus testarum BC008]MDJ0695811.1 photosystem I assembly protein Ycf4 [Mastigocoleus sp. MO_188.B34]MDJ0773827.1 photosystem I assembly protein Ycf4 [Mastigocoleus sp. MO_167.B18]